MQFMRSENSLNWVQHPIRKVCAAQRLNYVLRRINQEKCKLHSNDLRAPNKQTGSEQRIEFQKERSLSKITSRPVVVDFSRIFLAVFRVRYVREKETCGSYRHCESSTPDKRKSIGAFLAGSRKHFKRKTYQLEDFIMRTWKCERYTKGYTRSVFSSGTKGKNFRLTYGKTSFDVCRRVSSYHFVFRIKIACILNDSKCVSDI